MDGVARRSACAATPPAPKHVTTSMHTTEDLARRAMQTLVLQRRALVGGARPSPRCALCRLVAAQQPQQPATSLQDTTNPAFARLHVLAQVQLDTFVEVRLCPRCGTFYRYTLQPMTVQLSFSEDAGGEFTPTAEQCTPCNRRGLLATLRTFPTVTLEALTRRTQAELTWDLKRRGTLP